MNSDLEDAVWKGPCDTRQLFFVLTEQLGSFPQVAVTVDLRHRFAFVLSSVVQFNSTINYVIYFSLSKHHVKV